MAAASRKNPPKSPQSGVPFLLSQLGAHVSATFGRRIAALGLQKYHAGILSVLHNNPGLTQQSLADLLGMFPSRLVALLDDLGRRKLIERRESPTDRRTYALHLTKAGRDAWAKIGKLSVQMQDDLCAALSEKEQESLAGLLARIAAQQKITPGVHPGYRQMGGLCGDDDAAGLKG
jgi:DNA-binding MarR family transcriptional regulator